MRSTYVLSGYHIQAIDGEIGHVVDFVIDDETWAIRYLILDTTNWFGGKKVLISTKWIDKIRWNESKVFVNLSREDIKKSPEFTDEYSIVISALLSAFGNWLSGHFSESFFVVLHVVNFILNPASCDPFKSTVF